MTSIPFSPVMGGDPSGAGWRTTLVIGGVTLVLIVAAVVLPLGDRPAGGSAPVGGPRSIPSPVQLLKTGGVFLAKPTLSLAPWERPYPYTTPTPARTPSPIDGAYLRILDLAEVGGARVGLPIRCLRCIPFRVDAGTSTLVMYEGAYYLAHQISGFRTLGNFEVDGDRVTFFNDPNCPTTRGIYAWSRTGRHLTLRAIDDPCPFGHERADDLTADRWTWFEHCIVRFRDLWPGELGC